MLKLPIVYFMRMMMMMMLRLSFFYCRGIRAWALQDFRAQRALGIFEAMVLKSPHALLGGSWDLVSKVLL